MDPRYFIFAAGALVGLSIGTRAFPPAQAHDASDCPVCVATPEEIADLLEKLDRCEKKLAPATMSAEQREAIQQALEAVNAVEQKTAE